MRDMEKIMRIISDFGLPRTPISREAFVREVFDSGLLDNEIYLLQELDDLRLEDEKLLWKMHMWFPVFYYNKQIVNAIS